MFMDLESTLIHLRESGEGAHMPHVYYGDPHEEFSLQLINTLSNEADLLEFGVPFSDPTADGPTFQLACERALRAGMTPLKCVQAIRKLRKEGITLPIIVTTYYNIPYVYGITSFVKAIHTAGAQAILVPNLPIEEAQPLFAASHKHHIDVILQISPATSSSRIQHIVNAAHGFIYIINVEGVTGARNRFHKSTFQLIDTVSKQTDIPLLAGFGISQHQHAEAMVAAGVDGVIVGSAYAKIYEKNLTRPAKTLPKIQELAKQIKQGCIRGYNKRTRS
jgi:tryptophan synthase alpha chain